MHDRFGFSLLRTLAATLPVLCAVLGAIIGNVPLSAFGSFVPQPLFALMPVYFWCLVRPDLMPPPAALAIGILQDLLSGGQMGVWALSFVATYALVDRERDAFAGLSGLGALLGFATAMLVAGGTAYAIIGLSHEQLPRIEPLLAMAAVTIVLYLPVLGLLNQLHHRLIGPLRSDF
jgi:rod shape-determining protein MreD